MMTLQRDAGRQHLLPDLPHASAPAITTTEEIP